MLENDGVTTTYAIVIEAYDGVETSASGTQRETGYLALMRGEIIHIFDEDCRGHDGNRYELYAYGKLRGACDGHSYGWLPKQCINPIR